MRDPSLLHEFKRHKAAIDTRPLREEMVRGGPRLDAGLLRNRTAGHDGASHGPAASLDALDGTAVTVSASDLALNFPRTLAFLQGFASEQDAQLEHAVVVRFGPQGPSLPYEGETGAMLRDRYDICVTSRSGTLLVRLGERVLVQPGELWWSKGQFKHSIAAHSGEPHLHIVFDLLRNWGTKPPDGAHGAFEEPTGYSM